jgi:hypothetical protein
MGRAYSTGTVKSSCMAACVRRVDCQQMTPLVSTNDLPHPSLGAYGQSRHGIPRPPKAPAHHPHQRPADTGRAQGDRPAGGPAQRRGLPEQLPRRRLRDLQVQAHRGPRQGAHRDRLPAHGRGARRGLHPRVPERSANRPAARGGSLPCLGPRRVRPHRRADPRTHDITRLDVQLEQPIPYKAGQFAHLAIEGLLGRRAQLLVREPVPPRWAGHLPHSQGARRPGVVARERHGRRGSRSARGRPLRRLLACAGATRRCSSSRAAAVSHRSWRS